MGTERAGNFPEVKQNVVQMACGQALSAEGRSGAGNNTTKQAKPGQAMGDTARILVAYDRHLSH